MKPRPTTRRLAVLLTTTVLLASIAAVFALPTAAAGQTDVRLVPGADQLSVGETTTVEVVVTNAEGGVGAYNATVALDAEHATVTNASAGDARLTRVEVADDGSSARLVAALKDTPDEGSVTIATVTVEGATPGTSNLSLTVHALGDEQGRTYQVSDLIGASVTVTDRSTSPNTERATATAETGGTAIADGSDGPPIEDSAPIERVERTLSAPLVVSVVVVFVVAAILFDMFVGRRD